MRRLWWGVSPKRILADIQEEVQDLFNEIDGVDGNGPNIAELKASLVKVLGELDVAVQRAGRV